MVKLLAQIGESMGLKHGPVGPGGAVKADARAHPFKCPGDRFVGTAGGNKAAAGDLEVLALAEAEQKSRLLGEGGGGDSGGGEEE